ncbi:MAG: dihydropteroate synthase [Candidatus Palauibacterales bacterium]|nr:dihydropteroate synthase [Candidatus Palauibacterales bacterium]MDP2483589.1 dihydropteroate synthase [Candidatus Palauibacterales bacterium]
MAGPGGAVLSPETWSVCGREIRADRPVVLGVLNLTPDSFSDGGSLAGPEEALARAEQMRSEGADLIDVGGESTRPGARAVAPEQEWERIRAVVRGLAKRGIPVSIDTTKAVVAERAVDCGAAVLNDVSGLRNDPDLAGVAARAGAGLILMHMRGTPRTMQRDVEYADLLGEVKESLRRSMAVAVERGCHEGQLVIDPGIGFGKSAQGSLELIAGIGRLLDLGRPVLVGPSRKSFIGRVLDVSVEQRLEGTIAACVTAFERGARLFRVHDVRPVRRALDLAWAVRMAGGRAG